MEDIIDIIVTETTNTIEITSQSTDEVIDVNIIDNREDVTLNVTPTVVEININSLTGNFGVAWGEITGTLASQTDLNTALGLKADLVGGKVPSSQLPSYVDDVVEVANYAALPVTGETGKIYVVLDTNKIYRWSGSAYVEIIDSAAVWGAITGTLSSQTDLQNALNAKFDDPTGDTTQYIAGDGSLITFPIAGQSGTLVREVRNTTGATLTKGTIVYISGATGNKPTVSKAIATGDSTSAQTFGMCQADISNNSNGYVVCVGDLSGLDTSGLSEGAQLYLSSTTAGTYTTTKQLAPAHLVYIGIVTRAHPTLGQIEVKIQNGYELDEIHDVAIVSKANNDGLFYESSTNLWKNKSIATVLGYTPQAQLNGTGFVKASGTTISYDSSTYALDSAVVHNTTNENVAGIKTFTSGLSADYLWIKEGTGLANPSGYAQLATDLTYFHFNNSNNTAYARFLYGSGLRTYTLPDSNGTIALTSNLSSYLPLSGGTLTGALSGTSGTFTGNVSTSAQLRIESSGNAILVIGSRSAGTLFEIYNSSNVLRFYNGTNEALKIETGAGAATFSSSVAVGTNLTVGTASGGVSAPTNILMDGTYRTGGATFDALKLYLYKSSTETYGLGLGDLGDLQYWAGTTSTGAHRWFTSQTERMRITSSGNVGIGTTSPLAITNFTSLEVKGTSSGLIGVSSGAGSAFGRMYNDGSKLIIGTSTNNILVFDTNDTERMRITSSGNVLIGTSFAPAGNGLGIAIYKNDYPRITFRNSTTGDQASGGFQFYLNGNDFYQECPSNTIFANGGSERMRITSGGDLIFYGQSSSKIQFYSAYSGSPANVGLALFNTSGTTVIALNANGGGIYTASLGTGIVYSSGGSLTSTNPSDSRLKKNIKTITYGLSDIMKLRPVSYDWETDSINQGIQFGFIAQEVQEVMPDAIKEFGEETKFLGLEKDAIYATLVKAIQELKAELDTLKNK